jgi:hypothetical protein
VSAATWVVLAGDNYYPSGARDAREAFASPRKALAKAQALIAEEDWVEILRVGPDLRIAIFTIERGKPLPNIEAS